MSKTRRFGSALASGAAAAGAVRVGRFYRSLAYATGQTERVVAVTSDGWRLSMARYQAVGTPKGVIVAGHGFAGSSLIWDLAPSASLARYAAAAGYDFYALDLRGRGRSWPASGPARDLHWSFDDFVFHDLPAATSTARERSRCDTVFWLGLEMSGQAIYAASISSTVEVAGAVTFGSPVRTPADAKVPGVTAAPKARRRGRVLFRAGAHHAGPILALLRSGQLESSFVPANVDPIVPARYLRHGVPNESTRLADQFTDWVANDTMRSMDHATIWADRLDEVRVPLMMWAATRDLQRPLPAVRRAFDAMGSTDKTFVEAGRSTGFSVDYGHDDLVAAKSSPTEVFPRIIEWIDRRV
ncbi:MAG: alpha/beta fold hydrolase [Actinomycetota bacterium]